MTSYNEVQHEEQESATLINLNFGFYQCPDAVLKAKGLSWRAKCIYCRLLCYARENDTCFPGHARLAVDLGKSVDTIQRGLRELRDYGLITWKRRGLTKTNVYTIVKLSEVEALKNGLPLKPQKCTIKKPQESGPLKPQSCGNNYTKPSNTQVEPNEVLSNSSKGIAESTPACSHIAHSAIRKPEGNTIEPPLTSHRNTDTTSHTHPTPPNRSGLSKPETPGCRETGRQLQSLKRNDEVKPGRERPRMTAPPLTQEDMDIRIRERLSRERERTHNPLPGIISDEHWQELEAQNPTQQPTCRSRRQPVYEKLQLALEHISEELEDWNHVVSNVTQAENIRRESGLELESFLECIYDARSATKYAAVTGKITKRDAAGKLLKMPYFFAVLRQKVRVTKEKAS